MGPGFDCAGAALELWNELYLSLDDDLSVVVEGEGAGEVPADDTHLGVRAFSLIDSPQGLRFRFVNRIPLASGLGSSAATIAAGLVAASLWSGREPEAEDGSLQEPIPAYGPEFRRMVAETSILSSVVCEIR